MASMTRRSFLKTAAQQAAALPVLFSFAEGGASGLKPGDAENPYLREAMFWGWEDDGTIRCSLCPLDCIVEEGERGDCRVRTHRRENGKSKLYTLVYGRACTLNVDPIEKKPMFHFLPKTRVLSVATAGCNFTCKFCQNWNISQARPEDVRSSYWPPAKLVEAARSRALPSMAFTYAEPVVFYEYMLETAQAGRKENVRTVMISNGFIHAAPMKELCKHLAAVKVDFKGFSEKFYKDVCGGALKPVLDTMTLVVEQKVPLELVTLLVPGLNDSDEELKGMAKWVVKNLGRDVPLHFSRFHPQYKMTNIPATPLTTIEKAHDIAVAEGVHYSYVGNVPGHKYESTWCPKCGDLLIQRFGFYIARMRIEDGQCPKCQTRIPGVWK